MKKATIGFYIGYYIAALLLIVSLFYNKLLPDNISLILKIVIISLLAIECLIHFKKWILIFLSIVMFISSGGLFYSQYAISKLVNQQTIETNVISFVVLKNSPIIDVEDLINAKIGIPTQLDETIVAFVKSDISKIVSHYSVKIATDDASNYQYLLDKSIDMMVLDNSMRETLIEHFPYFETKTRTIRTIKKDIIKEDTSIPVMNVLEPFVILVSGIDSRTVGSVSDKARSDVNILMVINPSTHKVLTISIPRDTYTPLGCKTGAMDKLTHSGIYGADCTVKTVEKLFDIKINYYVKVNFTAFLNIIKVLGTIDVYSKYAFKMEVPKDPSKTASAVTKYSVKEGMNTMNALEALMFARTRHAFVDGDFQRGLNQQEVIKAMINKIISPSSLLKTPSLIDVASKSVMTNMPVESVTNLIQAQISKNVPWEFSSSTLTGKADSQPTYSMGSELLLSVIWPDQKSLINLKTKIRENLVLPKQ